MSQRFTHRSVVWRPPGGHRTVIRGPPSENLCYVDQTAAAGAPHGRLRVTARSSADCNDHPTVIGRQSTDLWTSPGDRQEP